MRALRVFRVVQGLAEDGEIQRLLLDRRILDVAEPVFQIRQAVLDGERLAELDHFRRKIHGDDLFGALGEQLGQGAFAGPEVGDHPVVEHLDERLGQRLPRTARARSPCRNARPVRRNRRGPCPCACASRWRSAALSAATSGTSSAASCATSIRSGAAVQEYMLFFPLRSSRHQSRRLELRKLGRNPALAHPEDLLQLRHRQRFAPHQHQNPQPRGVGKQFQ